jgi:hypothetical protein
VSASSRKSRMQASQPSSHRSASMSAPGLR